MKGIHRIVLVTLTFFLMAVPAFALGPVDGEVAAVWWANDFEVDSNAVAGSADGGAAGLRAQLWLKDRYGMKATQYGSDPSNSDGADFTSVDVLWRPLSPTENNFVAFGLGWQQMDVVGLDDAVSGARLSVEGRIGVVGMVYAYGNAAYSPSLDDSPAEDPLLGNFEDLASYEYEFGVAWNATPFVNVHAGYRVNALDFNQELLVPAGVPSVFSSVGGSSGPSASALAPGPPMDSCEDCAPSASVGQTTGSFETSGFFAGVGIKF